MHAVELDSPAKLAEHPLEWRETATPEPAPGQLRIKVAACGVCRSNLHTVEGDWLPEVPSKSPIVPGHELTGTVDRIGDGVTGWNVGDRAGVQPLWWTDEECEFCTSGREELCPRRKITGENVDGGYAEYMLSYAAHTYHVPSSLDLVDAAPLFCPGITAYHAVKKVDELGPGKNVAVFGLGGVGHMVVQWARLAGAEVAAVARRREHLDIARELGATRLVDASVQDAGEVLEESMDAVFSFADSNAVTAQGLRALKRGGTFVSGVPFTVQGLPFNKEQVVKAALLGSRKEMYEVLQLAAAGKVRTVVDRFPMPEAEAVLAKLAADQLRSRAVLVNA